MGLTLESQCVEAEQVLSQIQLLALSASPTCLPASLPPWDTAWVARTRVPQLKSAFGGPILPTCPELLPQEELKWSEQ